MSIPSNVHDSFFKEVFGRSDVAADFLKHYLPKDIISHMDMNVFEIVNNSFVDEELRSFYSDIIYKVYLNDDTESLVFVLVEHKSFPDRKVGYQLLGYLMKIWDYQMKNNPENPLSPIIPIVFYHGKRKWKSPKNCKCFFNFPEQYDKYLPDVNFELCDLSEYDEEDIKGEVLLRSAFLVLKYCFAPDFDVHLPRICSMLKELCTGKTGLDYLVTLLKYAVRASELIDEKVVKEAIRSATTEDMEDTMATLAEKWMKEGYDKGINKGILQGIQEGLQQGLKQGVQQGMQQGMQQGITQGLKEGLAQNIIDLLRIRFHNVPVYLENRINMINDISILRELFKKAAVTSSIEEYIDLTNVT